MGKMKQQYLELRGIEEYPLEEQIYQIFIGRGLRSTYGNRVDLRELAEEMVFALDFVNGGNPKQRVVLNTLPEFTDENGIEAKDLVIIFGLEDYIIESVLTA
jgi:hypothetical protein